MQGADGSLLTAKSARNSPVAYLTPGVLERLVISRDPPSVSVKELIEATYLPWAEQMGRSSVVRVSLR